MKKQTYYLLPIIGAVIGYGLIYPISTAIVMVFEFHQFSFAGYAQYLVRQGHVYTGLIFAAIGLVFGWIMTISRKKQDLVNRELTAINEYLAITNKSLVVSLEKEQSQVKVFFKGIHPTIIKIEKELMLLSNQRVRDIQFRYQLSQTAKQVRQISQLIEVSDLAYPGTSINPQSSKKIKDHQIAL
ncbi:MAG: hypothetical protein P1P77_15425 [Spirochaetaceae bacterium]|nr:hypothetical protein [Spirochaetaceae bacterium]